ncbi:PAS domain S-box protein [uncultured Methanoregula sp.]|uniref:PAS domain S-box protein n=1 Tax=uncultured Methanoregula sp. TaxID=1005933 RepID=UPI002AAABB73|nr:PAS domain S-box protein [uncultured Methanoregula sp.]
MKTENENNDLKILVVEDSRTQAEYLMHILESEGYQVVLALNGKEALEQIRIDRPTIVLTDIIMPEMDGYQLCSAIKKDENLRDLPVILVTQLFDPPDLIKGLEAGASDIIIKPFEPEHVVSRINSILQSMGHPESGGAGAAREVSFEGRTHIIPETQLRIPAIVLSSYNVAIRKNANLQESYEQLISVNDSLQQKVDDLKQTHEILLSSISTEKQQDAKKILENEDRFRMITELSPFPISIIDLSGNYQYVNKKFQHLFGYTINDIPPDEEWHPDAIFPGHEHSRIPGKKQDPEYTGWGEAIPHTSPVTCKDGKVRQIHFCPITLEGGEKFIVYEDLTDKLESERLRSVLVSIVNSSNDAIIGKALDGTILSWNKAAERYYGYLAEEIIGKPINLIVPPDLQEQLALFLRRAASGETIERFDTVRLRKDGSRFGVCVTLSPIKDEEGHIVGISTIAKNIAEREKSEVSRMFRQQVLHRR